MLRSVVDSCARLIEWGLRVERRRLVVIDASKGLAKAIQTTFGEWIVVQRCRVHKARNVLEHLPKHLRPWFQVRLRKIWRLECSATIRTVH